MTRKLQHAATLTSPVASALTGSDVQMSTGVTTVKKRALLLAGLALGGWWACQRLLWTALQPAPPLNDRASEPVHDPDYTNWDTITPSGNLSWVPCFRAHGNFLCARLTVPMDWNRPLDASGSNPEVHIALVMLPGDGHSLETRRFAPSPLIFNPGGPGGSGTQFMLSAAASLRAVVGSNHDLLSFDPRGVGATWPQADCFLDDFTPEDPPSRQERNHALLRRLTFKLELLEVGLANSTDKALALTLARARAQSQLCEAKDGRDSIFRHAGTPNVARDLLAIVRAWDAWTDGLGTTASAGHVEDRHASSLLDTRGKLVYWGFSYGTFLGSTFASMFPDSVGRLVLDGVMTTDVYTREVMGDALVDTDSVLASFFEYCHEARDKCYFYRGGDEPRDMEARYRRLLARLEEDPVIVIPGHVRMPVLVRASDLKAAVFGMLYFPVLTFPTLALVLFVLERGLDMSRLVATPDLAPVCDAAYAPVQYPEDSQLAILCSDRRSHWQETLPELQATFEKLSESSLFADYWMLAVSGCSGWNVDAVDPPGFSLADLPNRDAPPVNTSFPLLFVSNTYDPVTPMQNGLAMSRRFAGAGFVEVLATGHCSLAAVSLCAIRKIRAYLDLGIVPPPPSIDLAAGGAGGGRLTGHWERCESDERPWKPFEQLQLQYLALESEAAGILDAWREVQRLSREHVGRHLPAFRSPLDGVSDMDADVAAEVFEQLSAEPCATRTGAHGVLLNEL